MFLRLLIALIFILPSTKLHAAFDEEKFAEALGLDYVRGGNPFSFLGINRMYANDNMSRQLLVAADVLAELKEMRITKAKGYLILEIPKTENSYYSMALVGITEEEIYKNIKTSSLWKKIWNEFMPIKSAYAQDSCPIPGEPDVGPLEQLKKFYGTQFLMQMFQCLGPKLNHTLKGAWDSTGGLAQESVEGLANLVNDPKAFWDRRVQGIKNLIGFISHFDSKIKELSPALASLPPEIKTKMLCEFIGGLGADAAIIIMTGGAGLPKIIFRLEQFIQRLIKMDKVFIVLMRFGRIKMVPMGFWERLSANQITHKMVETMMTYAGHTTPDLLIRYMHSIF